MLNKYFIALPIHFAVSRAQFSVESLLCYIEGSLSPSRRLMFTVFSMCHAKSGIRIPIVATMLPVRISHTKHVHSLNAPCLCLVFCSILSFGAPQSNVYKIIAEGRGEMTFETTQVQKTFIGTMHSFLTSDSH